MQMERQNIKNCEEQVKCFNIFYNSKIFVNNKKIHDQN